MPVKKTGGAFVGEGTYGCTFSPAVACTDGRTLANKLGKVFANASSANDEFASVEVLRRIDPKQKLFIYPNETCDVKRGTMAAEPRGEKCAFAKDDPRDTLKQLLMAYGGITAHEFITSYIPKYTLSRATILHIVEHAFYAVKQLIKAEFVHQDIKTVNMVIMPGSNPNRFYEVKLIDFGTLISFDKFANFNKNILLGETYFLSPPEYRIMGRLLRISPESELTAEQKLLETAVQKKTYTSANIFSDAYVASLKKLNDELMGKNKPNRLRAFNAMNVANKSDIYSLGVMLLMLEQYAKPIIDDEPEVVPLFHELVRGCMMPHPHDRWSIDQAINAIRKLKAYSSYNPHQKITNTTSIQTEQRLNDIRQSKYFQDIFKKSPSASRNAHASASASSTPQQAKLPVRSSPTLRSSSASSNSSNSASTPFSLQARMSPGARTNRRQTQY